MRQHRRAIVTALFVAAAIVVVVVVVKVLSDSDDTSSVSRTPLAGAVMRQTPAQAPFEGLGELKVALGEDHCLRLAVADSLGERVAGLRNRTELGPYDGMLFVFPTPTDTAFTMSGVTAPLEIGFYGADGTPVSRLLMKPCPDKAQNQ